jgi:glycerol uptake facilitator-like aquaporin
MNTRNKAGLVFAEFFGTAVLASVALSVAQFFELTTAWYASVAVGVTLAAMVGVIGKVSGAHINPAITIGLWTLKKIPTPNAIVYIASQLLGGAVALAMFEYFTETEMAQASAAFDNRVFLAELVGMVVFSMGVAAAVTQKLEGHQAAFTIGASLMLGVLVASLGSPAFLNPAVALSADAWTRTFVLAPILGSVLGMNLYSLLLAPVESLKPYKKKK